MKFFYLRKNIIFLLLPILFLMNCSENTSQEKATIQSGGITVTDCLDRKITLQKPAQRIVLVRGRDIYELAVLFGNDLPNVIAALGPDLQSSDHDAYIKFTQKFP